MSERDELRWLVVDDPTHHSKTALDFAVETVIVGREHREAREKIENDSTS